mmetsp:Transcript_13131/g.18319  ORF Transcript_13131/g.18319 Transcript_13131/m.18319 type:complete len:84 (+) Transcript_13131:2-253(+)
MICDINSPAARSNPVKGSSKIINRLRGAHWRAREVRRAVPPLHSLPRLGRHPSHDLTLHCFQQTFHFHVAFRSRQLLGSTACL